MWILFLYLGAATVCCDVETAVAAESGEAATFEEAVDAAYRTNNGWLASKTEEKSAEEARRQAVGLLWLPNVQGRVSSGRSRAENVQTSVNPLKSMLGDDTPETKRSTEKSTQTAAGLSISQNLFNGFSGVNRVKAAENAAKAAHHKTKFEEQRLILRVLDAYTSVWVGWQKVVALKKKEENLKKTVDSKNSSMEAGIGTPPEVAQANANHQKAVYERIEAETELFTAQSEFEKLTGLKASKNIELPQLKFRLPESLEKLIARAMSANHSIRAAKFEEQAESCNLKAAKGALSPSCELSLDTSRTLNKQKYNNASNHYSINVQVTVPIFANSPSSGNAFSTIEIANQRALKAKFTSEDTLREVKKECIVNWNKYLAATAMIKAGLSAVESAELSTKSNQEENIMGVRSNTEILVEENQLLDARINLVNSKKQRLQVMAMICLLAGDLDKKSVCGK